MFLILLRITLYSNVEHEKSECTSSEAINLNTLCGYYSMGEQYLGRGNQGKSPTSPSFQNGIDRKKTMDKNEILALVCGQDLFREYTIRDVMELASSSYKPTYYALVELVQDGCFHMREEGRKHVFAVNLENPSVQKTVELLELRRREDALHSMEETRLQALEGLVERVRQEIPLFSAFLLRQDPRFVEMLFVIPQWDGHRERIRARCAEAGQAAGIQFRPAVATVEVFRQMLRTEHRRAIEAAVPMFGVEFLYLERSRMKAETPPVMAPIA